MANDLSGAASPLDGEDANQAASHEQKKQSLRKPVRFIYALRNRPSFANVAATPSRKR